MKDEPTNTGDSPPESFEIAQIEESLLALTRPIFSQHTRTKRDQIFLFSIAAVLLAFGLLSQSKLLGGLVSIPAWASALFLAVIVGYLLFSYWIDARADLHTFAIRAAAAREKLSEYVDWLLRLSEIRLQQASENVDRIKKKSQEFRDMKAEFSDPGYDLRSEEIDERFDFFNKELDMELDNQILNGELGNFIEFRKQLLDGAMQMEKRYKFSARLVSGSK